LKAALVVWFFMELKDDVAFNRLVFLGAVIFVGLFMAYTMNDTRHRNRVDAYNGARVDPRSGELAAGTAAGIVAQGGELGPLPVIAAESDGEVTHE
jgi:cytochrome c oxidase subunit 4